MCEGEACAVAREDTGGNSKFSRTKICSIRVYLTPPSCALGFNEKALGMNKKYSPLGGGGGCGNPDLFVSTHEAE